MVFSLCCKRPSSAQLHCEMGTLQQTECIKHAYITPCIFDNDCRATDIFDNVKFF